MVAVWALGVVPNLEWGVVRCALHGWLFGQNLGRGNSFFFFQFSTINTLKLIVYLSQYRDHIFLVYSIKNIIFYLVNKLNTTTIINIPYYNN